MAKKKDLMDLMKFIPPINLTDRVIADELVSDDDCITYAE